MTFSPSKFVVVTEAVTTTDDVPLLLLEITEVLVDAISEEVVAVVGEGVGMAPAVVGVVIAAPGGLATEDVGVVVVAPGVGVEAAGGVAAAAGGSPVGC